MISNQPQAVNWFEIPVTNMQESVALYSAPLDLKIEVTDFGGIPHALIGGGGALVADPRRPPQRGSGTVLYFNAGDGVKRALARAVEAGAKVIQPFTAIDPHGAIALIEDFDGNTFGLHENPPKS